MTPPGARSGLPLWHLAFVLLSLALATACRRKAPGPEECQRFALASIGVRTNAQLLLPSVVGRVNELTTECLLTPYDRELIACVDEGGAPRLCLREFMLRRGSLPEPRAARTRRIREP